MLRSWDRPCNCWAYSCRRRGYTFHEKVTQAIEPALTETLVRTSGQAAAAAAEARAAAESARGVGDTTRARAMQQSSHSSSAKTVDAPLGAARSWKLREALQQSCASAEASLLPPQVSASSSQQTCAGSSPASPLDIMPPGNDGNTCFLNAIVQCLRTVCSRLGVASPLVAFVPLHSILALRTPLEFLDCMMFEDDPPPDRLPAFYAVGTSVASFLEEL